MFNKTISLFCLMLYLISCQPKNEWQYPHFLWGFAVEGFPVTESMLSTLQKDTQIAPDIILFYLQWTEPSDIHIPLTPTLDAIWNQKAVPCMTWEPMFIKNNQEHTISVQDIIEGKYNDYINSISQEIKKWGKPIIIRFAHEMNLDRYHWGFDKEFFNDNAPENYIKMYSHVVQHFKQQNVTNVLWAFSPNVDSIPNQNWNRAENYFPPNSYVDILGMDGYNWGGTSWRPFESIFYPLYNQLKTIAPNKPIFVFETGTVNPEKTSWIESAIQTAQKWNLNGMIWFQVKKELDWRINEEEKYDYLNYIKTNPGVFQNWLTEYIQQRNDNKIIN